MKSIEISGAVSHLTHVHLTHVVDAFGDTAKTVAAKTVAMKTAYAREWGPRSAFFGELGGDTANGELVAALDGDLR